MKELDQLAANKIVSFKKFNVNFRLLGAQNNDFSNRKRIA